MPDDPEDEPAAVTDAADALYVLDPSEFLDRRAELVAAARAGGDPAAAKQIGALRKPTLAAWVVNAWIRQNPDVVDHLLDLNTRLRTAHDDLDATALRDLSGERRALVGSAARDALALAARTDPPAALRDDVVATFDAAVADPQIAARLGRLQRPEHWSGFGVAAPEGPLLRVVQGGRGSAPAASRAKSREADSGDEARGEPRTQDRSARRREQRILTKARTTFTDAESDLTDAEDAEQAAHAEVARLADELEQAQRALEEAKSGLDDARRAAKSARSRRREARSALDRAERNAAR